MAFPAPNKTIVGPTGRSPIKTVATPRYSTTPIKTVVGSTARPPRKDVVGNLAAPRPKTLVGNLAAPPPKTTPGNLGTGGKKPLGMEAADRGPINAGNPSTQSRSLGRGDGNLGRSVNNMPPRPQGPPNPVLSWEDESGSDGIVAGGQGAAAKRIGRAQKPQRGRNFRPSQFFGE